MGVNTETENQCICDDTLRSIYKEYSQYIGREYIDTADGMIYNFFGIVIGEDDFYYGLSSSHTNKTKLFSCVGSLEGLGLKLIPIYNKKIPLCDCGQYFEYHHSECPVSQFFENNCV